LSHLDFCAGIDYGSLRIDTKFNTALFNTTLSSFTPSSPNSAVDLAPRSPFALGSARTWLLFGAAVFLVSVPVFIQAPLVRWMPGFSLAATVGLVGLSAWWLARPATRLWGDLLLGFSLCWFAGSIYWGWLRWEPTWHLPIEALGLPFALWAWYKNWYRVGIFFYAGSLLGTAVTDLYFYTVDIIPHWRRLMQVEPSLAFTVLQEALVNIYTPWGLTWAAVLGLGLLIAGLLPFTVPAIRQGHPHGLHWWGFSGAVLSTLLVDGLFWVTAQLAG
jgi:hypothetical protein